MLSLCLVDDRMIVFEEIATALNISKGSGHKCFMNTQMFMYYTTCVPSSDTHSYNRIDLIVFKRLWTAWSDVLLDRLVTGNEAQMHHHDPLTGLSEWLESSRFTFISTIQGDKDRWQGDAHTSQGCERCHDDRLSGEQENCQRGRQYETSRPLRQRSKKCCLVVPFCSMTKLQSTSSLLHKLPFLSISSRWSTIHPIFQTASTDIKFDFKFEIKYFRGQRSVIDFSDRHESYEAMQ